jgi:hypothetical protein
MHVNCENTTHNHVESASLALKELFALELFVDNGDTWPAVFEGSTWLRAGSHGPHIGWHGLQGLNLLNPPNGPHGPHSVRFAWPAGLARV